jgi:hypothetical protein
MSIDWAYKSSTCDVISRRHSAAIYIMVVKFRNTIWPPPPPPQISPFIGELRWQAIQTEHVPYIEERTQKAVYLASLQQLIYAVKNLWL